MIFIVLILLGLCIGSFVNALVWRVHENAGSKKPSKKMSVLHGRSMCTHCRHSLAWYDLVPVVSWLFLRGRCQYCRKPISWQYPLVEIATALVFVLSYVFWPHQFLATADYLLFAGWLIVLASFVALCVYDIKWMELPDRIVYPMIILAAALAVLNIIISKDMDLVLHTVLSLVVASGLFYVLYQISNGKWIGGGDITLGILIGLLLQDPYKAFLMLMTASTLGTLFVVPGLLSKKVSTKSHIPFGPFLITATVVVYLFGQQIIDWYLSGLQV